MRYPPEEAERRRVAALKYYRENRDEIRARVKEQRKRPGYAEKKKAHENIPEVKARRQERSKKMCAERLADPARRAAHNARIQARRVKRRGLGLCHNCGADGQGNSVCLRCRYQNTIKNADIRGIEFTITREEWAALCATAGERCPATGLAWRDGGGQSADRLDNSKGYVSGNVHIVCSWFNILKNSCPVERFDEAMRGFAYVKELASK